MATSQRKYTEDDYESMVGMSALHQAAIDAEREKYYAAKEAGDREGMDAAHAQAEAIRALYDYSGGTDGSQYIRTQQPKQETTQLGDGFSYGSAPQYVSKYRDQINSLTQQLLTRPAFTYDHTQDQNYLQYEDQYTRGGQRAMRDTLGQVASRTGGLASSYAGSAAQQTYNGYMAELAGIIPELRQAAYEMYMEDYDRDLSDINALKAREDAEYALYQDRLGQWNTDRELAYNAYLNDRELQYQMERDAEEDARYKAEYEDGVAADEWNRSLTLAQVLAAAGDYSGYEALGYTQQQIAALEAAANQPEEYEPTLTYSQVMDAIERGSVTETVRRAYEYYLGEPYREPAGEGIDQRNYASIMQSMSRWAEDGNDNLIEQTLANNWDQMSEEQRKAVLAELSRLGYSVS